MSPVPESHQSVPSRCRPMFGSVSETIVFAYVYGMQLVHCVPSQTLSFGPGESSVDVMSSQSSPGVLFRPAFGAAVPTEQGPTLNREAPVSSAKNNPGSAELILTPGCPGRSLFASGRFWGTSDRRSWTGVTRFVAMVTRRRCDSVDPSRFEWFYPGITE